MSEDTRQTLEAYLEDLVSRGPYKRHFSDGVVMDMVGQDQRFEGPDAVEQMIDYMHRQAVDARREKRTRSSGMIRPPWSSISSASTPASSPVWRPRVGRSGFRTACGVRPGRREDHGVTPLHPMDVLMQQLGVAPAPEQSEEASPT
jgi:hypothetical protein